MSTVRPSQSEVIDDRLDKQWDAEMLDELWITLTGMDPDACSDDDDDSGEPGYEKDAAERRSDCERVRAILSEGRVDANLRGRHGATLLYYAMQYDHRHELEMIRVVVECGADVNTQTHEAGGELPLDSAWLEDEGPHAALNEQKRRFLVARGARHGAAKLAALAAEAADAAANAAAREAADVALDRRLADARDQWHVSRVPTWDDADDDATTLHG